MGENGRTAKLNRREILKMGAAGAASAFGPLAVADQMSQSQPTTGAGGENRRPNILFVFSDQHRWQSLPFTDMPEVHAPNFARLAEEGTSFDNCISTNPICVPYRGMLITGMWPHRSTIIGNTYFGNEDIIGVDAPTIAHTFRDGGYVTGYVGKWHLKSLGNKTMYQAGFDYFKHWLWGDNHWETKVHDIPTHEDYHVEKGYNAVGMTDQAFDFMREHAEGQKPFLMMLSWNPPHWRWNDAPEEFLEMYPEDELEFAPNVAERWKRGRLLEYYRHYHAHVSAIDEQMGRVMEELDRLGIADDTVLIYTSDHGSCLGAHGLGGKCNPYEESVRVPFLVRWPGRVPENRRTDDPIGAIDLYPTLCGLAGIEPPAHCGGQDLSHLLLGAEEPAPDAQFLQLNNNRNYYYDSMTGDVGPTSLHPFRGVRTRRYTYTVNDLGQWHLFDNLQDPYQLNNLVDDPAHEGLRRRLRERLDGFINEAEHPFVPDKWKGLPLAEYIRVQNEHWVLSRVEGRWEDYKEKVVAAHTREKTSPERVAELEAAADEVFDADFFGKYRGLKRRIDNTDVSRTERLSRLRSRLEAHEELYRERFKRRARDILHGE